MSIVRDRGRFRSKTILLGINAPFGDATDFRDGTTETGGSMY